ncbi:MAG: acylneuraminate cytidylyltransferase family protein [Clostridia bacterium]|nr:acylneuraminate cytidylyltransferase family protein [Clostridia bacterium]
MKERITAIIPAKGMSGRLPHKNTLAFGESNLLIHKIRTLKQVEEIKEIIVSSEDDEILAMAQAEGVKAIKRPYEFSAETKPFQDFLYYIVGEAREDHVMWACCTSPMVDVETLRKGCKTYFQKLKEGYDSLITVMEYHHYLLDKDMKPYTFKWGPDHRNSQDLDKLYFFTDGIQLAPKESMREWHYYFGHNPFGLEVDLKTSTDIDTIHDYLLARMQYFYNENEMKNNDVNPKEGEEVYNYILKKMVCTSNEKELNEILSCIEIEKLKKFINKE